MAYERSWPLVSSKLFTSTGGKSGQITVVSTAGLKVKQNVIVTSGTQPTLNLEVKRVNSGTSLEVGPEDKAISARTDLSLYTVGDGSAITANFQARNRIPIQEINRAVYEEEPTVAIRVVQVDQYGNILGGSGGVASDVNIRDGAGVPITSTTVGADQALDVNIVNPIPIDVDLDAFGDDDSVRIVGIDGVGTQHQLLVDTSGRLITSPMPGTEADAFSDPTGDGQIPLTGASDVIVSIAHTSGTYNISGWRYLADKDCQFTLEVRDGAVLVEIIDIDMNNPAPGGHRTFPTPIQIAGVATRTIRIVAERLQGTGGNAAAGINGYTT